MGDSSVATIVPDASKAEAGRRQRQSGWQARLAPSRAPRKTALQRPARTHARSVREILLAAGGSEAEECERWVSLDAVDRYEAASVRSFPRSGRVSSFSRRDGGMAAEEAGDGRGGVAI